MCMKKLKVKQCSILLDLVDIVRLLYGKLIIWQVLLLYIAIVYFLFLGLYSLANIRPYLVHVIYSL